MRTVPDLPPSLGQPSPHAVPATPGSSTGLVGMAAGCCLRHQSRGSALALTALLRVCLTMLHLGSLHVTACGFASGCLSQRGFGVPLCRPASDETVTCSPLALATWLLTPTILRLSLMVVHSWRRTLWDVINVTDTMSCGVSESYAIEQTCGKEEMNYTRGQTRVLLL